MDSDLAYSGKYSLFNKLSDTTLGKLVLSPTRTYAPVLKEIFQNYKQYISDMVHCTGGGQTKVLHFINNLHICKNNMFEIPPIFNLIKQESNASWKEMYKVFNMGHRMEIYLNQDVAQKIITVSKSFNLDAKIIGYVEKSNRKKLTIHSPEGVISY